MYVYNHYVYLQGRHILYIYICSYVICIHFYTCAKRHFAVFQKGTLCEEAKFRQRPLSLWIRWGAMSPSGLCPWGFAGLREKVFNGSTWVRRFFLQMPKMPLDILHNLRIMKGTWKGHDTSAFLKCIEKSIGFCRTHLPDNLFGWIHLSDFSPGKHHQFCIGFHWMFRIAHYITCIFVYDRCRYTS